MQSNVTLSKFYNVESDIHNLFPFIKLINLIIFIISLMIVRNINIVIIMLSFEIILLFATNIPLMVFVKNILLLKYLFLFIVFINYFSKISLEDTVLTLIKLIGILLSSNMFILTTTTNDIIKALNIFLKPLNKIGIKTQKLILLLTLSIRFIPTTFFEGKRILKSLKARGLDCQNNFKQIILGLKLLILPMFAQAIKRADKVADIMELKNYNFDVAPKYEKYRWNITDFFLVSVHIILFVIALSEVIR